MKLIIAGTKQQFRNWCDENKIDYRSKEVRFVHCREQLLGYRDAQVILYGTYYDLPDANELLAEVDHRKMIGDLK